MEVLTSVKICVKVCVKSHTHVASYPERPVVWKRPNAVRGRVGTGDGLHPARSRSSRDGVTHDAARSRSRRDGDAHNAALFAHDAVRSRSTRGSVSVGDAQCGRSRDVDGVAGGDAHDAARSPRRSGGVTHDAARSLGIVKGGDAHCGRSRSGRGVDVADDAARSRSPAFGDVSGGDAQFGRSRSGRGMDADAAGDVMHDAARSFGGVVGGDAQCGRSSVAWEERLNCFIRGRRHRRNAVSLSIATPSLDVNAVSLCLVRISNVTCVLQLRLFVFPSVCHSPIPFCPCSFLLSSLSPSVLPQCVSVCASVSSLPPILLFSLLLSVLLIVSGDLNPSVSLSFIQPSVSPSVLRQSYPFSGLSSPLSLLQSFCPFLVFLSLCLSLSPSVVFLVFLSLCLSLSLSSAPTSSLFCSCSVVSTDFRPRSI